MSILYKQGKQCGGEGLAGGAGGAYGQSWVWCGVGHDGDRAGRGRAGRPGGGGSLPYWACGQAWVWRGLNRAGAGQGGAGRARQARPGRQGVGLPILAPCTRQL